MKLNLRIPVYTTLIFYVIHVHIWFISKVNNFIYNYATNKIQRKKSKHSI